MFGSLDCTHTYWKNCPKAWNGSYVGKEDKPSIVLEGICDYNMYFWHVSYGYAGTLNDLSILNLSPFLERLVDGSYDSLEIEAGVVPFSIGEESFSKTFFLVDGIYPQYSRFVKGMKEPITNIEKQFTSWQEGARKDIERAFGLLKNTWKVLARPFLILNVADIGHRVTTCLLLHNVLVADRVMGEIGMEYCPLLDCDVDMVDISDPPDLHSVLMQNDVMDFAEVLDDLNGHPNSVRDTVTRRNRWAQLKDTGEHGRLTNALKNKFGGVE